MLCVLVDSAQVLLHVLTSMTNESLSTRIWNALIVNCKGRVMGASNLDDGLKSIVIAIQNDLLRCPSRSNVSQSKLAVDIKAPRVKLTILSQSNRVSIAS